VAHEACLLMRAWVLSVASRGSEIPERRLEQDPEGRGGAGGRWLLVRGRGAVLATAGWSAWEARRVLETALSVERARRPLR
jgi:hypothetical protein